MLKLRRFFKLFILYGFGLFPFLGTIVAVFYAIRNKNYKNVIILTLLFASCILFFNLDEYSIENQKKEKHNIENISDLESYYRKDISYYHPAYSLTKTTLSDGYHEEIVGKHSDKQIHKIQVEGGVYTSYTIVDSKDAFIENRLITLWDQQVENYKKDHPNKIVVFDESYDSYYDDIAAVIVFMMMAYSFFVVYSLTKDENSENDLNEIQEEYFEDEEEIVRTNGEDVLERDDYLSDLEDVLESKDTSDLTIDVNKATEDEFSALNGVSKIHAKYLVKEREDNGDYSSLKQFFKRNSISKRVEENIESQLFISSTKKAKKGKSKGRMLEF